MKLTKKILKRIIKEEIDSVLKEITLIPEVSLDTIKQEIEKRKGDAYQLRRYLMALGRQAGSGKIELSNDADDYLENEGYYDDYSTGYDEGQVEEGEEEQRQGQGEGGQEQGQRGGGSKYSITNS